MEFAIGVGIGIIIAMATRRRKKRRNRNQLSSGKSTQAEHKRMQQADEELITVILPTINNDK